MKINLIFFLVLFGSFQQAQASSIYLWEYVDMGERSCCLAFSGSDICNPHVPCTRHVESDLSGIYDYITRLLSMEKTQTFSYVKLLTQVKYYIHHALHTSFTQLSYRYDVYRAVTFYHEVTEKGASKAVDKSVKGGAASTTPDKAKVEEVVWKYMAKLGLCRPHKK